MRIWIGQDRMTVDSALGAVQTRVPGRIIQLFGLGALSGMEGGYAAYRISKAALNAVTRILASELRGAVAVNSMCPGWVKTDMGGEGADREVEQGADTAVWLAFFFPTISRESSCAIVRLSSGDASRGEHDTLAMARWGRGEDRLVVEAEPLSGGRHLVIDSWKHPSWAA